MSPFMPRIAGRTATLGVFGDFRRRRGAGDGAGAGAGGTGGGAEGAGPGRWRTAAASGSLGRLSACRNPGLRLRHMHNPPVAEILQPFSPKEVG
jgi:hypothetical protein